MRQRESDLQIACVRWFRYAYPQYGDLLFSVPNGGKRHPKTARRLKQEGVVAGVSDLILLLPNSEHHALCIEMKYGKGRQTDLQKAWMRQVRSAGYKYVVCNSFDMFEALVTDYIGAHG